jgi:hypothetical protein
MTEVETRRRTSGQRIHFFKFGTFSLRPDLSRCSAWGTFPKQVSTTSDYLVSTPHYPFTIRGYRTSSADFVLPDVSNHGQNGEVESKSIQRAVCRSRSKTSQVARWSGSSIYDWSVVRQLGEARAFDVITILCMTFRLVPVNDAHGAITKRRRSPVTTLRVVKRFERSHLSPPAVAPLIDVAKIFYAEGCFLTHGAGSVLELSGASGKEKVG